MSRARTLRAFSFALAFSVAGAFPAWAQWVPGGATVSDSAFTYAVLACPNGSGGAFVGWLGGSGEDPDNNIFCQELDSHGVRAFGPVGVRATAMSGDDYINGIVPDRAGGVFVVWEALSAGDLYAQHILADGSLAPGWPRNGAPISTAPYHQYYPTMLVDPSGNLIVFWDGGGPMDTSDIYCLRLGADGNPAPGWPVGGRLVLGTPGLRGGVYPIEDGQGGYYVAWEQAPSTSGPYSPYVLRLTSNLDPYPGWPVQGRLATAGRGIRGIASDQAGGVYLASVTLDTNFNEKDYYLHHFTGGGDLSPGWLSSGNPVRVGLPYYGFNLQVMSDEQDGAILQWQDSRAPDQGEVLYAMRMESDGTRAPGWPENGERVTNFAGFEEVSSMVADGRGGAYFGIDRPFGSELGCVQHLLADGTVAPGWPGSGLTLGVYARWPSLASDGAGGAIAAWYSNETFKPLAQHFVSDGIVATQLSLASSEVRSDRVTLEWQGDGASGIAAWVERRENEGDWVKVGEPSHEGSDRLRYEDDGVEAGGSYGYRLAWNEAGQTERTAENRVDVPKAATLELAGLRPNPAAGELRVEFSLASSAPATLEMLDLAGRRVAQREVGSLGAGRHQTRLEAGGGVAPGVYWLRLRQGADSRLVRGVVMR